MRLRCEQRTRFPLSNVKSNNEMVMTRAVGEKENESDRIIFRIRIH